MTTRSSKILGVAVNILAPYAADHVLSANEAIVLNQVRAENVGNNMRTRVKEMQEAGADAAAIVAEVDVYDREYDLNTASTRRGGLSDLERLSRTIATDHVNKAIIASGKTVKEIKETNPDGYKALVASTAANDAVIKAATLQLKRQSQLDTGVDLSGLATPESS